MLGQDKNNAFAGSSPVASIRLRRSSRHFVIVTTAKALAIGVAIIIANLSLAAAQTGATDCSAISANTQDKIVLDEVKGVRSISSDIQRERLKSVINMQLPMIQSELHEFVKLVFCEKRKPDEDSFDKSRSDLLNEFGVVLEIWGEVEQSGSILYYAVIPIRTYEYFAKLNTNLTGFYVVQYGAPTAAQDAPEGLPFETTTS